MVAATALDIKAETIAGAVAGRSDMTLVASRVLTVSELDALVGSQSLRGPCCIVLVGPDAATEAPAARYLAECADYVVLRVSAPLGDAVRVAATQVGLLGVLEALRALVQSAGTTRPRVGHLRLDSVASPGEHRAAWQVFAAMAAS